jgi:hypothetical protein
MALIGQINISGRFTTLEKSPVPNEYVTGWAQEQVWTV